MESAKLAPPSRSLPRVLLRAVPLALVVFSALVAALKLTVDVRYPFGLDYGEGVVLEGVHAALGGRPIYPPLNDTHYAVSIYMPLYVWICTALGRVWGASFLLGRVVSASATAVCVALVHRLARGFGASRRHSLLAALLFFTSTPVIAFGALMRVDTLGLAFSLGGLAVMQAGGSALWAGGLFALAILCKQSMLAAFFACCLYLAAQRRWRDLGVLLPAAVLPVAAVCAWETAATSGWFWFHVVTANRTPYRLAWLVRWMSEVPVRHAPLALLAIAGWHPLRQQRTEQRPSLLACYLIGACGTALLVGRVGAVLNFFLDYAAALAVAAAVGMGRLLAGPQDETRPPLREAVVALALLLHVAVVTAMPDLCGVTASLPGLRRVTEVLARANGDVLSDDPSLVAGAGRRLILEPFQYTQMGRTGIWRTDALVARLGQGAFAVIAIRFDPWNSSQRLRDGTWADGRLSDEMVDAIRRAYCVEEGWGALYVLRPRSKAH